MKKALITGGTGFIGLNLAGLLTQHGVQVDLLDNFSRGSKSEQVIKLAKNPLVDVLERDLRDGAALADLADDYSHIFHLAAIVGVANVDARPFATLADNVRMALSALDLAARQRSLERLVFASTSEVYAGSLGMTEFPIPTPETVDIRLPNLARPRSSYMLSKIYGEALTLHSGLPITNIRPHNVYGPRMGMAHAIPELLKRAWQLSSGTPLKVYSVEQTRTFCFVDDAVEQIRLLAESHEALGECVNVGNQGPEIRIGELAEIILRTVGKNNPIEPMPAPAGSPERRCPDMAKCAQITGYTARIDLEEGARRTFEWYRKHIFEPLATVAP